MGREAFSNPLCIISNYFFDSIPNDVFHVNEGAFYEALTRLSSDQSDVDRNNIEGTRIDAITTQFDHHSVDTNYYHDPKIDSILEEYRKKLYSASFNFPIASIRVLEKLKALSDNRLLVISSDKGYSRMSEIQGRGDPYVAPHHGAFSMMVNYHALGEYCKNGGGDVHHQSMNEGISTCVLVSNAQIKDLTHTNLAIQRSIDHFGPSDFFNYHSHFRDDKFSFKMKFGYIISYLKISQWDPRVFSLLIEDVIEQLPSLSEGQLRLLELGAEKCGDNVFDMPGIQKTYFDIGALFYRLHKSEKALPFFLKSIECYGESYNILFNTALCYQNLGQSEQALSYFQKTQQIDDTEDVREWISYINS